MRKHLSITAAAALAVAGMGLTASNTWAQATENQLNSAAQRTENTAESAGQAAQNSADRTGDAAERAADRAGDAAQRAAEKTGDAANRAADKTGAALDNAAQGHGLKGTAQAPDAEGIRDLLAQVAEATFTPGGFDDLVERFADADRNRIGQNMPNENDLKPMDDQVKQFRDDWKNKYGQDFDISNEELVFNETFQIQQSELGAAQTAGGREGADARQPSGENQTGDRALLGNSDLQSSPDNKAGRHGGTRMTDAADKDLAQRRSGDNISGSSNASTNSESTEIAGAGETNRTTGSQPGSTGQPPQHEQQPTAQTDPAASAGPAASVDRPAGSDVDANREPGRNVAQVTVPSSHGMPQLTVPLIHELPDSWRIDVPDTVDATKLRTNLTQAVTKVSGMRDQWPSDVNEAYRMVSHAVLAAALDQQQSAGQAQ